MDPSANPHRRLPLPTMTSPVEDLLPADTVLPDLVQVGGAHSVAKRVAWLVGSVVCFALGIVGWLVPVITGIPFYIASIAMLAKAIPAVGRWLNRWDRGQPLRRRLWLRPRLRSQLLAEARATSDDGGRATDD